MNNYFNLVWQFLRIFNKYFQGCFCLIIYVFCFILYIAYTIVLPLLTIRVLFKQFIAQNQKDMHSWIEAVNNSSSKPPTPEIMHSASPICFKQELLPNRQLPVPPTADFPIQDYFYDKPNPIIRPVNLYVDPTDEVDTDESIYHFIDESKREKDTTPKVSTRLVIL